MSETFPFIIRGPTENSRTHLKKFSGENFDRALDKALMRYPSKFVKFIKQRNKGHPIVEVPFKPKLIVQPFKLIINTMDLMTAKAEAANQSKEQKKKLYVNLDDERECIIESIPAKIKELVMAAFVNGSEVPLDSEEAKNTKTNEKLRKISKTNKMGKSKSTPKKAVKKTESKPAAKKEKVEGIIYRATRIWLTKEQWKKFDDGGVKLQTVATAAVSAKMKL